MAGAQRTGGSDRLACRTARVRDIQEKPRILTFLIDLLCVTIMKPATLRFLDSKKLSNIASRRVSDFFQGDPLYRRNRFSN